MRNFLKFAFLLTLVLAILAVVTGTVLWHEFASHPGVTISINGEDLQLEELSSMHWVSGLFGIGVATIVVLVVVPLVVLLGVGLPLLLIGGGVALAVAALAGVGMLISSPLLVLALVIWLLVRGSRTERRPRGNPEPRERQEPVA